MKQKMKVGIVGCGNICGIYFKNLRTFSAVETAACADLILERAKAKAAEFHVPKAYSVRELMADPQIDIVLNLTIPRAHAEIALQALSNGKHVYGEKPLSVTMKEGGQIMELAKRKKLRVGSAPDTFLGAGIQTCRKLIDDGWIGRPVAATAFMTCRGHESWHPDPDFYYQLGGGPMFDMGPYYLTALVNLLGPVKRVAGSTQSAFKTRVITSQPKFGTIIKVNTPTHVAGTLDFANGAVGTIITSFDVWAAELPRIEIYGTEGSLSVPDPNGFGGPVKLRLPGYDGWKDVPLTHSFGDNTRGVGVADMATGIMEGRVHRASGRMAYHILEVMHSFQKSSESNKHVMIASTCERPEPLPMRPMPGTVDCTGAV